jgi:hypothetical protein
VGQGGSMDGIIEILVFSHRFQESAAAKSFTPDPSDQPIKDRLEPFFWGSILGIEKPA